MDFQKIINLVLDYASKNGFSDVHINSNSKIKIRDKNWEIVEITEELWTQIDVLTKENVKDVINVLIWEKWFTEFLKNLEYDSSYMISSGDRYRVNCYNDTNGYSVALRLIPSEIPTLEQLWLGSQIEKLCQKNKWLVLVTWPTGSGKSTNLAAMINYINTNYKKHIITIEDPVEFAFKSKKSHINQREVWSQTLWFANAIRASLREDPDVIMIWEMRDPETIKAAITLAETGHLVFSTLHTNDAVQTIDRIVDVFPWAQHNQIRMQLSQSLAWIISQRLLPRADKEWRVAAREVLLSNDAVRNLIQSGKTHQLYSVLEVWKKEWMILMDKYLQILYDKKIISKETLLSYVRDKETIEMMIN